MQMLHVMALPVMAILLSYPKEDLDPVLPTPLSEVDNINFDVSGPNFEIFMNNKSSKNIQPLLSNSYKFWEHKTVIHRMYFMNSAPQY